MTAPIRKPENIYLSLLSLAVPILIGQVGSIVVAFADNMMVGHYSTEALAAASFVNNVFNIAFLGVMGFTYGLTPLVGALFTDKRKPTQNKIGSLVRVGLRVNTVFTVVVMAVMTILYFNIEHLGQPRALLPLIRPYYLTVLAGVIPFMVFNVFAQWSYAINNTRMPMWIILGANALNVLGNWLLIFGHWGLPELGLTGAGISTFLSRLMSGVVIYLIFSRKRFYGAYFAGFRHRLTAGVKASKIWVTSIPISIQMICETGSFSVAAIMAGWLGTISLAALQIIIIIGTLGFCIYYSFGAAVAVKVSNAAGTGNCAAMRRIAWKGYHIMLVLMLTASLIFGFGGRTLMSVFTDDAEVLSMAAALIVPLICYQLGDATQVNFANALRGTSRVMPMLWIAFFSYIVVGIPATYIMTFTIGWGMLGLVGSFSVSLFLAGSLFLTFFLRATRH